MVKVILFHLFNGQQVVGIDEEPLAITHASTTILAATKAGRVEGFAAGAEYVRAFSFETANDGITGLHHVPALDCVVTLERESAHSRINVVRAYYRYHPLTTTDQAAAATEAADGTTTGRYASAGSLVQLAVPWSVHTLAVCGATGRVLAGGERGLSLWALHEEGQAPEHLMDLDTSHSLPVRRLAIHRDYLAYASSNELFVLHFQLVPRSGTSTSSSLPST
ncbi:uncharacterized protein ACA1_284090 [Acanthamoeba castellanii str. Neff]|uniref:Uncharacterized protein n=1 Tax=Acanthamoeba castellanii (strain ATCC 30010 / Neff) TaxID=1257118 RepID=L8H9S4_ACACF|nr:uncharacterized protein ACA1_284090 [Acanthamoeba castellanii str. Neff]ELR21161.1 hypothetical protein ACA1_284090 [Acanthamoeba castellanii str. Neff]